MTKTIFKYVVLVMFFIFFSNCKPQNKKQTKINGISFVASRDSIAQKDILPIKNLNANWVSIMPYGFLRQKDSTTLYYNIDRQWFGERYDGAKQYIELMHKNNIQVMLKPQIWIGGGEFTGFIDMKSESDWQVFEKKYADMILLYAKLAEETQTKLFCLGTELHNFVIKRPDFWVQLIKEIKAVYSGKLTYAENWDKIDHVPFWNQLDYIGVDAYFPISEAQTSTLDAIKTTWQPISENLKALSESHQIPILFTEFGYRSIDYAGKTPWESNRVNGQINEKAQAVLLQGLMESLWIKTWFAGGFLWKWFHHHDKPSERHANRFSIQYKTAEDVVKNIYSNFE